MKFIRQAILLLFFWINTSHGFSLSKIDGEPQYKRLKRDYYWLNGLLLETEDDGSEYAINNPAVTFQYPPKEINSYEIYLPDNNEWDINTNTAPDLDDSLNLEYVPESDNDASDKTFFCIGYLCPTENNNQKDQIEDVKDTTKEHGSKEDTIDATASVGSKDKPCIEDLKGINIDIKNDSNKSDNKYNLNSLNYISFEDKPDIIHNPNIWNIVNSVLDLIKEFNKNTAKKQTTPKDEDTQLDPKKSSFYENLQGLFTNIITDNVFINNVNSTFSEPFILPNKEKIHETDTGKNVNKQETTSSNFEPNIDSTTPKDNPDEVPPEIVHNKDINIVTPLIESTTSETIHKESDLNKITDQNSGKVVSSTVEPFNKDKNEIEEEKEPTEYHQSISDKILDLILNFISSEEFWDILGNLFRKYLESLASDTETTNKFDKIRPESAFNKDKDITTTLMESTTNKLSIGDAFDKTTDNYLDEIVVSTKAPFNKDNNKDEKAKFWDFMGSLANKYLESLISNSTEITNEPNKDLTAYAHNEQKDTTTSPIESTTDKYSQSDDFNKNTDHNSDEIVSSTEEQFNKGKNKIEKEMDLTENHQSVPNNILDNILYFISSEEFWDFLENLVNKYLESLKSNATKIAKKSDKMPAELTHNKDKNITTSPIESTTNKPPEDGGFDKSTDQNSGEIMFNTKEQFNEDKNKDKKENGKFWDYLESLAQKYLEPLISHLADFANNPDRVPTEFADKKHKDITSPTESTSNKHSQGDDINKKSESNDIVSSMEEPFSKDKNKIEKGKHSIEIAKKSDEIPPEFTHNDSDIITTSPTESTTNNLSNGDALDKTADHISDENQSKVDKEKTKFWEYLSSLANKYFESLISHTNKFIKDEIAYQFHEYFDGLKNKSSVIDDHKDKNILQEPFDKINNSDDIKEYDMRKNHNKTKNPEDSEKSAEKRDGVKNTSASKNIDKNYDTPETSPENTDKVEGIAVDTSKAKDKNKKDKDLEIPAKKHDNTEIASIHASEIKDKNKEDHTSDTSVEESVKVKDKNEEPLETSTEKQDAKDIPVHTSKAKGKNEKDNAPETSPEKYSKAKDNTAQVSEIEDKNEEDMGPEISAEKHGKVKDKDSETPQEKYDNAKDASIHGSQVDDKNEVDNASVIYEKKHDNAKNETDTVKDKKDTSSEKSAEKYKNPKDTSLNASEAKDKHKEDNATETSAGKNDYEIDYSVHISKDKDKNEKDNNTETYSNENGSNNHKTEDNSKVDDKLEQDNAIKTSVTTDKNSNEQDEKVKSEDKAKNNTTNSSQSKDDKEKNKPEDQIKDEDEKHIDTSPSESKNKKKEANSKDSTEEPLNYFDNNIEYITGNPTTKVTTI